MGMSVNPGIRAHAILDQLRQRHLVHVGTLSRDYVSNVMAWEPSYTPFASALLTLALLRNLQNSTPHTSPYRDPIEYVLLCRLPDDNVQPLLIFYNVVKSGARVPALHHGDLALLPKKVAHGIVGNIRPLINLFVLWKVLSMHFASTLQAFLSTHGRVCGEHFAAWPRTSVADVVRVIHDWFLFFWSRGQQASLVLDDCIHAFGSLSHATIRGTLLAAGSLASLVDLLISALCSMLFHMGGHRHLEEALARHEPGLGQRDPISALLHCLLGAVRAALALASTGLLATPTVPLRRLGWDDDHSRLDASHSATQRLVSHLPASRVATDLSCDNVKTVAIGTELRLGRLHIVSEPLYPLGSLLQRIGAGDFICFLGRHALPHQFHRQVLAKFMKAGRRATAAVAPLSLASHYPISMYNGVAGGTRRWCAQVQPPLYRAMRLGVPPGSVTSALHLAFGCFQPP